MSLEKYILENALKHSVQQFTKEHSSNEHGPCNEAGSVLTGISNEMNNPGSQKGAMFLCGYLSGLLHFISYVITVLHSEFPKDSNHSDTKHTNKSGDDCYSTCARCRGPTIDCR